MRWGTGVSPVRYGRPRCCSQHTVLGSTVQTLKDGLQAGDGGKAALKTGRYGARHMAENQFGS